MCINRFSICISKCNLFYFILTIRCKCLLTILPPIVFYSPCWREMAHPKKDTWHGGCGEKTHLMLLYETDHQAALSSVSPLKMLFFSPVGSTFQITITRIFDIQSRLKYSKETLRLSMCVHTVPCQTINHMSWMWINKLNISIISFKSALLFMREYWSFKNFRGKC